MKNAFNTLSWSKIFEEVESRGIPRKLVALLENYLEDRKIIVRTTKGTVKRNVYAGVPQGSILGPLLWNLVYDVKAIPKMNAVTFADDLAVILYVAKQEEAENKLSTAVGMIVQCCADKGLKIAQEKTEVILLTGKRR